MNTLFKYLLAFLMFTLISSCGEEEPVMQVTPTLSLAPSSVIFNDDETTTFSIRHVAGDVINWQIASLPTWLKADALSGQVSPNQAKEIVLSAETEGFPIGKLTGVIEVIWDQNQSRTLNVTVCVDAKPELALDQTELLFNEINGYYAFITAKNIGTGILNLDIISQDPNLFVDISGERTLDEGETTFINVSYNLPIGQSAGLIETSFIVLTDSDAGDITIPVNIEIPEQASLFVNFFDTNFGLTKNEVVVELYNDGNIDLDWSIVPGNMILEGITISPESGNLGAGQNMNVIFTLDRTGIPNGNYNGDFYVQATGGLMEFVFLDYQVYNEDKILLDGQVIDAQYSTNDNMYVIQEFPNQLVKYDSNNDILDKKDLAFTPTELAVSPEGEYGLVIGLNQVSLINLNDLTEVKGIAYNSNISSATVDDVGDVFVFTSTELISYNLDNDEFTTLNLINVNIDKAKIHPGGNYLYAIANETSECLKFNISSNTVVLTESYSLPFNPESKFWFGGNGTQMITQSAHTYNLTPDSSNDLNYGKRIQIPDSFLDLYYSSALNIFAGVIGFIDNYNPTQIFVEGGYRFRASDCTQEKAFPEFFFVVEQYNDFLEPGVARFVGVNESSVEYVVVGSTFDTSSNAPWAITKLKIE